MLRDWLQFWWMWLFTTLLSSPTSVLTLRSGMWKPETPKAQLSAQYAGNRFISTHGPDAGLQLGLVTINPSGGGISVLTARLSQQHKHVSIVEIR